MMKMNLRVVLLGKLAKLSPENLEAPPLEPEIPQGQLPLFIQEPDFWFSQGHFDILRTYKPERQVSLGVFQNIHTFNGLIANVSNADCYYHPLYLLTEEDDSDFWRARKNFLAVVRVHFAKSVPDANVHEQLSGKLKQEFEHKGCLFRAYYTVELSDMVLTIQSDIIRNLLEEVMQLRECPEIGRVYTYCGIHKQLLETPDGHGTVADTDEIPLCAMRFAVHNPPKVEDALTVIRSYLGKENAYAVVGVDDIIINWKDLPVKRMTKLYSSWYKSPQAAQDTVFSAFSSITTRMGTLYDWKISTPTERDTLSNACDEIAEQIAKIRSKIGDWQRKDTPVRIDQEHSWIFPLSELSIALARLSKTSVLDEFAYLMLPAAKSFLENILDRLSLERIKDFSDLELENCRLFVESWVHLLEHVMRVEGQLTQLPQMRPMLYDIPLILLEHLLAFAGKCAEILRGLDKDYNAREIQFLFVPRLCERIESAELFQAEVTSYRNLPGLVLVSIPVYKMYEIGEIQMVLCHEISHFVGEDCRKREDRIGYYAKAVGRLVEACIFQTNSDKFLEACENWCQKLLEECDFDEVKYIKDMEEKVEECLGRKFYPWEHQCDAPLEAAQVEFFDWTRELLLYAYEKGAWCVPAQFNYECVRMAAEELFSLLDAISSLFREIYADVCMLLLLEIDPDQYAVMRIGDLDDIDDGALLEMVSYQIYIALKATGHDIQNLEFMRSNETTYNEWPYPILKEILLAIKQETITLNDFFGKCNGYQYQYRIPPKCAEAILEYATKCADQLKESLNKETCKDDIEKLHTMFENSRKADVDYKELQAGILEYRETCLGMFTNNERNA